MNHTKKIKELQDEQDEMWDTLSTPYQAPGQQTIFDYDISSMYPTSLDGITKGDLIVFSAQVGMGKSKYEKK